VFNGSVVLDADTTIDATQSEEVPVRFGDTVDGAHALTVRTGGTLTFTGPVGATTPLSSLTATGVEFVEIEGGSVTTTGNQTSSFTTSPLVSPLFDLDGPTTLTGATITVGAPLSGSDLTIHASGDTNLDAVDLNGDLTITSAGHTDFNGSVSVA